MNEVSVFWMKNFNAQQAKKFSSASKGNSQILTHIFLNVECLCQKIWSYLELKYCIL